MPEVQKEIEKEFELERLILFSDVILTHYIFLVLITILVLLIFKIN